MDLEKLIRDVPDFPKKGIMYKDITPLLADAQGFHEAVRKLAEPYFDQQIKTVVGIESRGFIFASAVAHCLHAGLVPLRKKGKLPAKTVKVEYDLEYGKDTIEIHADAIQKGDKVLIVDDLLATGGTMAAACKLVAQQGARIEGVAFLVELAFLHGADKIGDYKIHSLIKVD